MQLMEYLPLYFANIEEFSHLMAAEQPEIGTLEASIKALEDNLFLATLDAEGCEHWEKILGITNPASDIEDRRFVIQTKYSDSLPYTWLSLIARLDGLLGEGNYEHTEDRENYTLTVKIELVRSYQQKEVQDMLERLLPCNLIVAATLRYNTHSMFEGYTHAELEDFTHSVMKEGVIT